MRSSCVNVVFGPFDDTFRGPFDDSYKPTTIWTGASAEPEPTPTDIPSGGGDGGSWDPELDPANPLKQDRELVPA